MAGSRYAIITSNIIQSRRKLQNLGGLHIKLLKIGGRNLEINLEIDLDNRFYVSRMDKIH